MNLAIVLSAPPMRQVFRGIDVRSVAIVAERALWPLLESNLSVTVSVQCGKKDVQAKLETYFLELIRSDREFRSLDRTPKDAGSNSARA